jgi:hypothetical protein
MANRYLLIFRQILNKLATPVTFVLIGAVARIIPHMPNFAPIGAMALFGGAHMNKKQALTLPLLAMVFSDFIIGFDSVPMRFAVYGSFLLIVLMGMFIKNHVNAKNVIIVSLLASILFFIITNFAVWAFGSMYPKTALGLGEAYFLAIPFFRNTLLGDLFYSGVFFGVYNLLLNTSPRVALQQKRG